MSSTPENAAHLPGAPKAWPRDDAKLDRVRALLAERDLDALVVRAPDSVLYLSNYWCMKGYDVVVFPREGDPTLVVMEPQLEEAAHTAWTDDLRPFQGYDAERPTAGLGALDRPRTGGLP